MKLSDFDFDLPDSFIAQIPLEDRTASKLFVFNKETREKHHVQVKDLPNILSENDVLVFNKSRVIPARIVFEHGEIFLSRPREERVWNCLVKPGRKFKEGKVFEFSDGMQAEVLEVHEDGTRDIRFCFDGQFQEWLQKYGEIPQPPYVKEKIKNPNRYQTTFSGDAGKSVAAPTAGLHFTPELLEVLKAKGVETHFVHLDVGLGTFLPVKTENVLEHQMHYESFSLDEKTANALNEAKRKGKRIIAVGTTSIRVLESCAVPPSPPTPLPEGAGSYLKPCSGETNIFIYPGYKFKFVDAVFTNFHTPKSTLLMLVSAFLESTPESIRLRSQSGRGQVLALYEEAKKENYRFYSFGDAMLIL